MVRWLVCGATVLVGIALALPAVVASQEHSEWSTASQGMLALGVAMVILGAPLAMRMSRRLSRQNVPVSVLLPTAISAVWIALLVLEISSGLTRERDVMARSWYFLPLAIVLFWGLLSGRWWAWHAARWVSAFFGLLFVGAGAATLVWRFQPTVDSQDASQILLNSFILSTLLLAGGFFPLGRSAARAHFGIAAKPIK